MTRRLWFLLVWWTLAPLSAEDRTRSTTHRWPFGTIEVLEPLPRPEDPAPPLPGALRAQTRGTFRLKYRLVRENGTVAPRDLHVTVDNRARYHDTPTLRLQEHEGVHMDINHREARRIEKVLSSFRGEGLTMAEAEKALQNRFRQELTATRRLHADWDENQVFLSTAPVVQPK